MATILEVAAHAGVSTATVSRVLSGSGGAVSEQLAARVRASAQALGYRSNRAARALRRARSDTIALVFPDVEQPFFTSIARAVEERAAHLGRPTVVCNTDEDLERESFYLDLMLAERVAGIIVAPSSEDRSTLRPVLDTGTPIVAVDRAVDGDAVSSVLTDHRGGARLLVEELVGHGHRRVGAIVGTTAATPSRLRIAGAQDALDGVRGGRLMVAEAKPRGAIGTTTTITMAYTTALQLLDERHPPTAVFCGNSVIAQGVWKALRAAGRRIPDDVALVSFDDYPVFDLLEPAITVAAQRADVIGATAVDLLEARISDPDLPVETRVLPAELRIRASCGSHAESPGPQVPPPTTAGTATR